MPISHVIDAVIPAHEKDLDTLDYCIEGIRKNIPGVRRIIVISKSKYTDKAEWFNEALFPFSFQEISNYVGKSNTGWHLQQLIKLYAIFVIPNIADNILIVDSDTVFMHKVEMIGKDGIPLYNPSKDQDILKNPFYLRVLEHTKKVLPELNLENIPEEYREISGISHHMLFQRHVMQDLFKRAEANDKDGDSFYKIFLKYSNHSHSASEYIIYYFFILVYYRSQIKFRKLSYKNTADLNIWKYRIRRKYDYCSFHSYMRQDKKPIIITQKISEKIKKIIDKLFYYELWNIGIIESRIEELLEDKDLRIKWLKSRKCKFYQFCADPFGFKWIDNQRYIIYEKFDYCSKIGDIAVSKLDNNFNLSEEKIIISDQIHSSYPYIFLDENQFYVLIERNKSNSLDLYRMDAPDKLTKIKTLLHNSRIIDPTIVKHNNIWWIFFTSHEVGDNKLQIAYSDELLGEWKMHPQNPVKVDNSSSRPAGTPFLFGGNLYRPAQNCSKSYGGSVVINKIIKLSKTEFIEEKFKEILPKKNNEYNLGIHTISALEDITIIDGKKRKFALFKIIISFYRIFYKGLNLRKFKK